MPWSNLGAERAGRSRESQWWRTGLVREMEWLGSGRGHVPPQQGCPCIIVSCLTVRSQLFLLVQMSLQLEHAHVGRPVLVVLKCSQRLLVYFIHADKGFVVAPLSSKLFILISLDGYWWCSWDVLGMRFYICNASHPQQEIALRSIEGKVLHLTKIDKSLLLSV